MASILSITKAGIIMIKLGVLGAGIISECHFYAIDKLKDVKITAIASADADEGERAAKKYGAVLYKDYKELLDKEKGLDAVIVALPNHMHCEASEYAIRAGHKKIFCEKPMTRNREEGARLAKLVKETGVLFQTGYMKRFNPGFQIIKDTLAEIGEIEFVTAGIFNASPDPEIVRQKGRGKGTWHSDPELAGGGFLYNSGSHHVDLLRYLFGDIKSVECNLRFLFDVNDDYYVNAALHTEAGVEITMRLGRVDVPSLGPNWEPYRRPAWNEFVEVIGTKGYVRADNPNWRGWDVMKASRWLSGMSGPETCQLDCAEQWVNEFTAFTESCKTGVLSKRASSVIDGYRADCVLEQMRHSAAQNGRELEMKYDY